MINRRALFAAALGAMGCYAFPAAAKGKSHVVTVRIPPGAIEKAMEKIRRQLDERDELIAARIEELVADRISQIGQEDRNGKNS